MLVSVVLVGLVVPAMADGGNKAEGSAELYDFILPGAGYGYVGNWGVAAGDFIVCEGLFGLEENAANDNNNSAGLVYLVLGLGARYLFIKGAGRAADKHNQALPNRGLPSKVSLAPVINLDGKALSMGLSANMNF
jgi:hypothetical protein